jgi:ribosomal protein S18 acetylase RimI-like enzyme
LKTTIHPVTCRSEIDAIVDLAGTIWHEHYDPIIGPQQVDYMLEQFQSHAAVSAQIAQGYYYHYAKTADLVTGYLATIIEPGTDSLLISKIYVEQAARGQGIGGMLLDTAEALGNNHGIASLRLTVNRHNTDSINWYRKKGFVITGEVDADIGNGYYMNDYVMLKQLSESQAK